MAKIIPEAVTLSKDGQSGLSCNALNAALVEAIKEQQKQIDDLKTEVNLLKK